jgi:uncharacterized protein (DUF2249 family)
MTINANTKISALLKQNPAALEAIISISPRFNKLRNPVLRKLMASRTTINMASKIGGCTPDDFFEKLSPLGFKADKDILAEETIHGEIPDFMKRAFPLQITELDVRPVIESGKDPLLLIREKLKQLQPNGILKLVNTFEPVPLILLMEKQGYETFVETTGDNIVNTYFHARGELRPDTEVKASAKWGWDELQERFSNHLITIDVRSLEMPLPMLTILEKLEHITTKNALFVYHKRIPVFLLPELEERKFDYRLKELGDDEVHMLIFKK